MLLIAVSPVSLCLKACRKWVFCRNVAIGFTLLPEGCDVIAPSLKYCEQNVFNILNSRLTLKAKITLNTLGTQTPRAQELLGHIMEAR